MGEKDNYDMDSYATGAPEKIEVFIDDQPVLVDPGTTVLQVDYFHISTSILLFFNGYNFLKGCCYGWS